MARRRQRIDESAAWRRIEDLLNRDDDRFVDALRRITNGEALGDFAKTWHDDARPQARRLMLLYLCRPLNAYRHDALIKRLFKLAENDQDDELMAHFLVLFDCAVRRVTMPSRRYLHREFATEAEARQQLIEWERAGADATQVWSSGSRREHRWHAHGSIRETGYRLPAGGTIPKPRHERDWKQAIAVTDEQREEFEQCRLFSPETRNYLRRRAWRYFRKLGKTTPERYVGAVSVALKLYEDEDVGDGLALIDNWGLMHALFHFSPVLSSEPRGWRVARGRKLSELEPAPYFELLWKAEPFELLDLLREARCRPVRQWAIALLRRDHQAILARLSVDELFALLGSQAIEVVELAADLLRAHPSLDQVSGDRWLQLLDTENADVLNVVCQIMEERLRPELVSLADAVRFAKSKPLPIARLGFVWVRAQRPASEDDCEALLGLADAEAAQLRLEMVQWARAVLRRSPFFRPEWVLELLDSQHPEVRSEGWNWLVEGSRLRDNVDVWQKLFESPYDDVRLNLITDLERRVSRGEPSWLEREQLDEDLLRFLWASVLLNVHRGSRLKPLALQQITRRLQRKPEEAELLLPLLRVSLRSIRGPEWRSALTQIVRWIEQRPEMTNLVGEALPELQLNEST